MVRVKRFSDPMAAERAAAYLRACGVPAMVVGQHIHHAAAIPGLRFTQVEIVVPDEPLRARAEELLAEFDDAPMNMGDELDAAAAPDLSRLNLRKHPVACPSCRSDLAQSRVRPGEAFSCPKCREAVDLTALVLERYGPEALMDCYDAEAQPAFDVETWRCVLCARCGYDLSGLPQRGRCPECGDLFDKADLPGRR